MKPVSLFTTPRRLIAPISRHFLPVEHPEPFCCTTGLKNGSRLPFIAHFFSSGLGVLAAIGLLKGSAAAFAAGAAAWAATATLAGASCLGAGAAGFAACAFSTAGFTAGAAGFVACAFSTTGFG